MKEKSWIPFNDPYIVNIVKQQQGNTILQETYCYACGYKNKVKNVPCINCKYPEDIL